MSGCKDGFNCIFCQEPTGSGDGMVQHAWNHRQAGHLPFATIGCPQCLKVGEVDKVFKDFHPNPEVLHYRCKCGHLFSSGSPVRAPGPFKRISDLDPADLKPGPIIEIEPPRGPGIKLDGKKDDLWTHVLDNFPMALGWLAAHMETGDNEPGHVHHGWRDVPDGYNRYSAALMRHLLAEKIDVDKISYLDKVDMATAVLANAFIRLEILLKMPVTFEEPKVETGAPAPDVLESRGSR